MNLNPISYQIENNMLHASAEGELLFEDIVAHYQDLFSSPDFYVGMPAIYDFSLVSKMSGDLSYFEKTAQDMGDASIINKDSFVAIIIPADNKSLNGIFNAYSHMMDFTHMHVSIFHSKEKAQIWLASQNLK